MCHILAAQAKTVVAPLDRVKILFQTANPDFQKYAGTWHGAYRAGRDIYKVSGIRGLLQGHSATLLRVFPYAAVQFMAYEQVHHRYLLAYAGVISVLFTYPLEVIRVRMAYQTRIANESSLHRSRTSLARIVSLIYSESSTSMSSSANKLPSLLLASSIMKSQLSFAPSTVAQTQKRLFSCFPLLKFYRGFSVTVMGMIPYAGTSFLTWGFLRSHIVQPPTASSPQPGLNPLVNLVIGALSGAIAQTVSYPFEVVRRRMQVGGLTRPDRWLQLSETVGTVWATGGWRGFFAGLGIGYIKIVPMTAVTYTVWQEGKRVLGV
ncbi:hypothetical protein HWV62_9575 [Athelia sp. TMB]|nr:hypothetical protein HWV62_9575 [Athelia sp. TMB]